MQITPSVFAVRSTAPLIVTLAGIPTAAFVAGEPGRKDSGYVVIDEAAG